MKLIFGISTITSPSHMTNEDAVEVITGNTAILADGMGGEANPEQASHIALETIKSELTRIPSDASPEQNKEFLEKAIRKANTEVLEKVPGGGSTVSIAKIMLHESKNPVLVYANTGDSRIALFREPAGLISVTEDHNLLLACYERIYSNLVNQYGVKQLTVSRYQEIQKKLNEVTDITTLDAEERVYFDHRNLVFGGIGITDNPVIDTKIITFEIQDRIVVMSDGIHDNLTTQDMEQILLETKDLEPKEQAEQLVQRAKEVSEKGDRNGRGKQDDITAVVFYLK